MAEQLLDLIELQKVLQDYARDAEEIYKYQLSLGGKTASRKLMDTLKSRVDVNGTEYDVTLSLEYYWKFVEGGSKGTESSPPGAVYPAHFPPVKALTDWILIKPVLPRPDFNGNMEQLKPKSLAFLIGRKIKEHGIEPHPALKTTQEELDKMYREKLSIALGHDISNYIRKVLPTK